MRTFTATAPDGTTKTRKTENGVYPFAVAAYYAPRPEYFDKYANRTRPATPGSWAITSFHTTRAAAEKASGPRRNADRWVVVETEETP